MSKHLCPLTRDNEKYQNDGRCMDRDREHVQAWTDVKNKVGQSQTNLTKHAYIPYVLLVQAKTNTNSSSDGPERASISSSRVHHTFQRSLFSLVVWRLDCLV